MIIVRQWVAHLDFDIIIADAGSPILEVAIMRYDKGDLIPLISYIHKPLVYLKTISTFQAKSF